MWQAQSPISWRFSPMCLRQAVFSPALSIARAVLWFGGVSARGAAPSPDEPWLGKRLEHFQDLKFGFMMHFGAYSQWGCIESWPLVEEDKWARPDDLPPWVQRGRDIKRFQKDYFDLPKTFNPIHFDPRAWAQAAKGAGMKYVVFTSKHHDGFCMFDTRLTDYRVTATDVPFHSNARSNVVREVFQAFRRENLLIGAYFSKADWHCPDYWDPNRPARTLQKANLIHGWRGIQRPQLFIMAFDWLPRAASRNRRPVAARPNPLRAIQAHGGRVADFARR